MLQIKKKVLPLKHKFNFSIKREFFPDKLKKKTIYTNFIISNYNTYYYSIKLENKIIFFLYKYSNFIDLFLYKL